MKIFSSYVAYFWQKFIPIMGIVVLISSLAWLVFLNKDNSPPTLVKQSLSNNTHDNISRHIQEVFDSAGIHRNKPKLKYKLIIEEFYHQRNWQPVWHNKNTLSALRDSALYVLSNVYIYGLLPEFYDLFQLKKEIAVAYSTENADEKDSLIALLDIHITERLLHLMSHLHHGKLKPTAFQAQQNQDWLKKEGLSLLCRAIAKKRFTKSFEEGQPQLSLYKQLQQSLAHFVHTSSLDSTSIQIPDPKSDSLASYKAVQKALIQNGYLSTKDTFPILQARMQDAIMQFQQANGLEADGKTGAKTRASLSRSNWERFCQSAINLERLRKENITDSAYLFLNIPAFQLYVYERDHIVQTHRLIVGRPQTPTHPLSSQIKYIVIAPQWNVPYSIATKEMLPRIKANINYLAENNLMVFNKNGQMVDPYTIDWGKLNTGNFPYAIRQQQGCDNALGNIMFYFPNSYSTFLHDTPNRKAFNQTNRALSHGCMRVENPIEVANFILSREAVADRLNVDDVENCQLNRKRKQINLKYPFSIHVRYLTCGSQNHKLLFYPDIYKQDIPLLKTFLSRE